MPKNLLNEPKHTHSGLKFPLEWTNRRYFGYKFKVSIPFYSNTFVRCEGIFRWYIFNSYAGANFSDQWQLWAKLIGAGVCALQLWKFFGWLSVTRTLDEPKVPKVNLIKWHRSFKPIFYGNQPILLGIYGWCIWFSYCKIFFVQQFKFRHQTRPLIFNNFEQLTI